ncbi:hypothetical protein V1J52_25355 [Streptomyces sp. TRM 70351]|uniref:hypothetical protein n=1 Tax=Streptomyces sp. TRM 70351 TaxID=3116552 RepID=UPI002E7B2052|nr:hypothetical protein [Streptomyces sp. TRM 70351]MEE1931451.1 hypothetical protein [Streptomyces sp. TRM 70351]
MLPSGEGHGEHAARTVVQQLATSNGLIGVVKTLLDSPEALRSSARRSHAHDNGFDKITLASSASGWRLRLNIWWPDRGVHTENIHNHRWDFASFMLAGSCLADYFQPASDGTPMYGYEYAKGVNSSYHHRFLGRRQVSLAVSGTIRRGDSYLLTRSLMHRIVTDRRDLVATLMLHSPQRSETAITLTDSPLFDEQPSAAPSLYTDVALQRRLSTFLECHAPF